MTTLPCARCAARIDSRIYANHLKHCPPKRQAPVVEVVELHPRTAYQKRISAERQRRFGGKP